MTEPTVKWYSMRQLAKELGMSVNTFKKHYMKRFSPDRENERYKGYTHKSLTHIKEQLSL